MTSTQVFCGPITQRHTHTHRTLPYLCLTPGSSSDGGEGGRSGGGSLRHGEVSRGAESLGGAWAAARGGVLDGLDGMAPIHGGQTGRRIKVILVFNHEP